MQKSQIQVKMPNKNIIYLTQCPLLQHSASRQREILFQETTRQIEKGLDQQVQSNPVQSATQRPDVIFSDHKQVILKQTNFL